VKTQRVSPREKRPLFGLLYLEDPRTVASYSIRQQAPGDNYLLRVHLAIVVAMATLRPLKFL
jgi:hypothetical protein